MDLSRVHFNLQLLLKEFEKRGISLRLIPETDLIEARWKDHREFFVGMETRLVPSSYFLILDNKYNAKRILKDNGLEVLEGYVFPRERMELVVECAENKLGYPVVLKPVDGTHGEFVFVNLDGFAELSACYRYFVSRSNFREILVEKYFSGADDYRFFVMQGRNPAVVRRTPPRVTGDGRSTIEQLIQRENFRRLNPRTTCEGEISIQDFEARRVLSRMDLTLQSVLDRGQVIQLRNNANVYWGGQCENVSELVHPGFIDLSRKILGLFSGLPYLGIDILARDITLPPEKGNYAVTELDCNPGYSLHTHPGRGAPVDIIPPIVDLLFPETVADGITN